MLDKIYFNKLRKDDFIDFFPEKNFVPPFASSDAQCCFLYVNVRTFLWHSPSTLYNREGKGRVKFIFTLRKNEFMQNILVKIVATLSTYLFIRADTEALPCLL